MKPGQIAAKAWTVCYEFLNNTDGGEEVLTEADIVWDFLAALNENQMPPSTLALSWEIAPKWATNGAVTPSGLLVWASGPLRVEGPGWKPVDPAIRMTTIGQMEIPLGYDWRLSSQSLTKQTKETA